MKMNIRQAQEHPYPNPHENSLMSPLRSAKKEIKFYFPVLTILEPHTTKDGKDIWGYCFKVLSLIIESQQHISELYIHETCTYIKQLEC